MPQESFFATCPRGLEILMGEELSQLGAVNVKPADAGVAFFGTRETTMRANLESRLASRILWLRDTGPYTDAQDIYDAALRLPWEQWMTPDQTLRVDTQAHRSPLKSLDFVTLRVKDAICDRFRDQYQKRPSVDPRSPDVRVHVYVTENRYHLYLDTTGDALFKRGLRMEAGQAPLKKNLAAGILRLAGWRPGVPLLDPFCGSGTFLVEAAEQALNRAPGLGRAFGFERLQGWPQETWRTLMAEATRRGQPPRPLPLWGYDLKGDALDSARHNLTVAGLLDCVQLKQVNFLESSPPAPSGIIVTNPPYGVRMGEQEELARLYPLIGDVLKQRYAGWNAYFFTADRQLARLIRLKTSRKTPLFNGALECRLFEIRVIAGSHRKT